MRRQGDWGVVVEGFDSKTKTQPYRCVIRSQTGVYYSVKRDLLQCQKRPTTVSKETYYSVILYIASLHEHTKLPKAHTRSTLKVPL